MKKQINKVAKTASIYKEVLAERIATYASELYFVFFKYNKGSKPFSEKKQSLLLKILELINKNVPEQKHLGGLELGTYSFIWNKWMRDSKTSRMSQWSFIRPKELHVRMYEDDAETIRRYDHAYDVKTCERFGMLFRYLPAILEELKEANKYKTSPVSYVLNKLFTRLIVDGVQVLIKLGSKYIAGKSKVKETTTASYCAELEHAFSVLCQLEMRKYYVKYYAPIPGEQDTMLNALKVQVEALSPELKAEAEELFELAK